MREISISEFRQCLALMDHLPAEGILITRQGRPVAKLLPVRSASCANLIGSVPILAGSADDLFSTGEHWEANAES